MPRNLTNKQNILTLVKFRYIIKLSSEKGTIIMKATKRLLAAILSIVMMICAVPFSVGAEDTLTTADGFEYTVDTEKGEVTITGYTGDETDLVIPSEIDGYPVKAIGNNAFENGSFEKVTLEGNVETIGNFAFDSCASLKAVELCHGVVYIGEGAFAFCRKLESLSFTYSVKELGWRALYSIHNVGDSFSIYYLGTAKQWNKIILNGNDGYFYPAPTIYYVQDVYCENGVEYTVDTETLEATVTGQTTTEETVEILSEIEGFPVKYIGKAAFQDNSYIKSIYVPENIEVIESSAFSGCTNLENVYVENVKSIGDSAFGNCESLKSVNIGNVEKMGYGVFSDCTSLTCVEISGLKALPAQTFINCSLLSTVILPEGLLEIGGSAFAHCSSLESIDIPSTVTVINDYAFYECTGLKSIKLPNVLTVNKAVFGGCKSLESINIPISVDMIGDRAFESCESLKEITVPGLVKSIGAGAFAGCTSLSVVNIVSPLGIESIGMYAFSNCSSLERFTVARTVTAVGDSAFAGCEGLLEIDYHGTKADWKKIVFGEGNELFLSLPIKYHSAANNKGMTFEYDRQNLTATLVKFETTVTTSLEIPAEINGYKVTKIGMGCVKINNRLKEVIIPDTVTEIGEGAFYYGSCLEKITIPASVKKIGKGAFMYPIDDAIYYTGTEEEWNDIEIDERDNYGLLKSKVVFIKNGDANKDGKLNAVDANLMKRYLAGQVDAYAICLEYADLNGDGAITAVDSLLIKRKLAGAEA